MSTLLKESDAGAQHAGVQPAWPSIRMLLRFAPLVVVAAAAVAYRGQLAVAAAKMADLHPMALLALPFFLLSNHVATFSWIRLLEAVTPGRSAPTVWSLASIRIQGKVFNLVLPTAGVGGELLKVSLATRLTSDAIGSASTLLLDNVANTVAGFSFAIAFASVYAAALTAGGYTLWPIIVVGVALVAVLAAVPFMLTAIARASDRSSDTSLGRLFALFRDNPAQLRLAFGRGVAWHLLERALLALEIYVAVVALGYDISIVDSMFVSAVLTVATFLFFFVPGQLGAADLGIVSALSLLGLPPTVGLTVALVRRARQLALIAIGLALWIADHPLRAVADCPVTTNASDRAT